MSSPPPSTAHVLERNSVKLAVHEQREEPMRASQISLSISGWTGGVSAAVLMIPVGRFAVVLVVPVGSPGLAALAAGCSAQLLALVLP
jgi:hypothetical protein